MDDPGKLVVFWSKRERGLLYRFPRSADGHFAYAAFELPRHRGGLFEEATVQLPSLVQELERRGYDVTTLRFECKRKPKPVNRTETQSGSPAAPAAPSE